MEGLAFGSINFSDYQGRDESNDVKNGDVISSQEVHHNLAVKDSINGNANVVEEGPMECKDVRHWTPCYPLRPEADNCPYFMRYGCCKFGWNCKYNHPFNMNSLQVIKEKTKPKEESINGVGQLECKYYLTPEGCKHGKACRYNHSRRKTVEAPVLEFNFFGLPIRPGEKECPDYKQIGSCKYGVKCWFDHPDPSSMGGGFPISVYTGSEQTMPFWSLAGPGNGFAPFEVTMCQSVQCAPYAEWTGNQVGLEHHEALIYTTSGRSQSTPLASDAKPYHPQQQTVLAKESPKPNLQPQHSFKSGYGFCHPKTSSCPVSDKGLPLRPDMEVCEFYVRYGVCKKGPACKFDHPVPQAKPIPAAGCEEAPHLPDTTSEDNN